MTERNKEQSSTNYIHTVKTRSLSPLKLVLVLTYLVALLADGKKNNNGGSNKQTLDLWLCYA